MTLAAIVLVFLAGCGRLGFGGDGNASDAQLPLGTQICAIPPRPDVSNPTTIVGDGTAGSCTDTALRAAIGTGGVVRLDCGIATTIPVASEIVVTTDTVIDARGTRLDGQGTTRILHVPPTGAVLTLLDAVIANGNTSQSGGGVFLDAGSLVTYGTVFTGNRAATLSPFDGGGAVAASPPAATIALYDSAFMNNAGANGGAVKAFADLAVAGTTFTMNTASGNGGPMGQGGLGGAISASGSGNVTLCAVALQDNSAGNLGGAIHRVSVNGAGVDRWDRVVLDGNASAMATGGAYVQGSALRLRQVSIVRNTGSEGTFWYISASALDAENVTITDNTSTSGLGAGLRVDATPGTLRFSTIASNHAACAACFAAAVEGGQNLTLVSSVIANNLADTQSAPASCRLAAIDGGGNFQWPNETPLCAAGAQVIDPVLGALAATSGPGGTYSVRKPALGSPVSGVSSSCPDEDVVGRVRPRPCAAGAVEP